MSARWCVGALLLLSAARPVSAQDVEVLARAGGRALPAGYYERMRSDPGFFEIDRGWTARNLLVAPHAAVVQGTLPLAVVQVLFADSPEPTITPADIQRVLFDGPTPFGTLTEFYREISGGRLLVTGRVLPWVRTAIGRAEVVGTSYGLGNDSQVGTFLVQALNAVDDLVDFAQFDNDGPDNVPNSGDDDGFVDAVAFQFLERAASCGGDGIWPHRSRISGWRPQTDGPYATRDLRPNGEPIKVNDYIIQSTVACDGVTPLSASVIAHELGHVLGLPDLYHAASGILPSQRRWVLGCWTLMAAGAWGCGDGSTFGIAQRPSHMGPWEKSTLGWIAEELVGSVREQEFVLQPVQTSGRSLRVPLGVTEYLQLEYRPRLGFDIDLPASGVLIYHIDLSRPLYPPAAGARIYRIALQEADGDSALRRTALEGGNRGVAGDAWALAGNASFSAVTTPALRRNSGAASTVTIHSIAISGGVARVRLSTAAAPALVSDAQQLGVAQALGAYTAQLRAAGGALPYQWAVQGALPQGVIFEANGATVSFRGTPLERGRFTVLLHITDALGTSVSETVTLDVTAASLAEARLLQSFLRSAAQPLTTSELQYLDNAGNRNGRYDVGDLRRQLRAQQTAA